MGIYSDAELIWGIPVTDNDPETGEYTAFWDEENEDWVDFGDELEVCHYGHYEDSTQHGILTSKRVDALTGDCWGTTPVYPDDLLITDNTLSKANDAAREYALDVDFYTDARWNLVASVG